MKKYYKEVGESYGKMTPSNIGYALGWLLGKILLLAGGYCLGQILRGFLKALGVILPSIF